MLDVAFILAGEMAPAQGSTLAEMLTIDGIQTVQHGIKTVMIHDKLLPCTAQSLRFELFLQGFTNGAGKRGGVMRRYQTARFTLLDNAGNAAYVTGYDWNSYGQGLQA